MAYYMLYVRENGVWGPQFGDTSRAPVMFERDEYKSHGTLWRNLKIVIFPRTPTEAQIRDKAIELNQGTTP